MSSAADHRQVPGIDGFRRFDRTGVSVPARGQRPPQSGPPPVHDDRTAPRQGRLLQRLQHASRLDVRVHDRAGPGVQGGKGDPRAETLCRNRQPGRVRRPDLQKRVEPELEFACKTTVTMHSFKKFFIMFRIGAEISL